MNHAAKQKKHLAYRLKGRFGLKVPKGRAQSDLKKLIYKSKAIYLGKGTPETRTKFMVLYQNQLMTIVYDKKTKVVVTAWGI